MITLYAFGRAHPGMIGEARDLRVQWAHEETGLPYRVRALDYIAGKLEGPAYSELSYFHQVPVIDDDGFVVGESGAVLLYIAEKAGKLIPADFAGRTRVVPGWSAGWTAASGSRALSSRSPTSSSPPSCGKSATPI